MGTLRKATRKIILHCSASDKPEEDSVEAIRAFHMANGREILTWGEYKTNGRQFKDIGYHYVITKDGAYHVGRPENETGAHCVGHNQDSIGICLSGNMHFTQMQFDTLRKLIEILVEKYNLKKTSVYAHNYFSSIKNCPNFDVKFVWPEAQERFDE